LDEAAHRGVLENDVLLSLLLALPPADLARAKALGLLPTYLRNWTEFTSCFHSAAQMFELFGRGDVVASGAAVRNDGNSIVAAADALCHGVDQAAGLFEVKYGIHGFAIAVHAGKAELVQSFAGANAGAPIAEFLREGKIYTVPELVELLRHMVNPDNDTRAGAQSALFGGEIEDAQTRWPNLDFSWRQRTLKDLDTLRADIRARLDENARTIAGRT